MGKSAITLSSKLAVAAVCLIAIILLVGCTPAFKPKVKLQLDKNSVDVTDNKVSTDFITATITRTDAVEDDSVIILKFPQNMTSVYAVDIDGKRISELTTRPLKGANSIDTLQFKVLGKKGEALTATYSLELELWWNNTRIEGSQKSVKVVVK